MSETNFSPLLLSDEENFAVSTPEKNTELTAQESSPDPAASGIYFSVSAAEKVASLIAEEANPNLNLRVVINGGGCSGFQYGFTFDEIIQTDDTVVMQQCAGGQTVKLLVDSISHQYLNNAEIDYVKGIQGEQFIIRNPNAKTTCGCGSSFSMDDDE